MSFDDAEQLISLSSECALYWLCASVAFASVPGLWRGYHGDNTNATSGSFVDGRVNKVSSAIGVISGSVCLLWCGLTGRRWSVYRMRGVLSSDLFKAGSFGRHALPASRGFDYATAGEKTDLQSLGSQNGCHTCGRHIDTLAQRRRELLRTKADTQPPSQTHVVLPYKPNAARSGVTRDKATPIPVQADFFIADHIPPSGLVRSKWWWQSREQLFYPQCPTCSANQSLAVRMKRRTLQMHHWRRFTSSDLYPPPLFLILYVTPAVQHLVLHAHTLSL